jgi:hypothetical protein
VSGRQDQGVRPLLLVVAGLAIFTLVGSPRASLDPLARAEALAPLVLVPAAVVAALAFAARVIVTRRALRSRVTLVVLVPDSFDPSLDAVLRCAGQVSRVRRLVGGWFDPRARAVRVLLDTEDEGRMRYSLAVPERALPAVRSALGSFDRVQVQAVEASPEPPRRDPIGWRSFAPSCASPAPSSEPLAQLPLTPDPLQGFAAVLARLDPAHRERAEVAIDLLPTTAATRRRLRRRLLKEALRRSRDPSGVRQGFLDFERRHVGHRRPAEMVEQRAEREEIAAKLVQAEPIFRLQALIRCCSTERGRAVGCLQGLLSCFDGFAGANSLRVVGVRFVGLAFAGSDRTRTPCRRSRAASPSPSSPRECSSSTSLGLARERGSRAGTSLPLADSAPTRRSAGSRRSSTPSPQR